ncbi:hypothetical protein CcaverHIS002_0208820 [Cutaneotrichosporon cavernicola]|uniref:COPI associated n=1 Tax=Cutaneotrichosporon cavernicola TaxID=279322 RepID=A0AA48IE63_9TREE|nr:uncharacterized protein CcaverHIS019_0208830 [Cutaneotrichosporon cavernicola]BEI81722.1 hypothetical protein CcaverHIS002_0208820 [Cutaneotrichosporon cavernicola]BEI89521.1 hypothetical protein CcaverHIS019_0208830 [Cutaneotrichosporon cavernicola]BEI97294.1 hypothetical protein CcaverHIS631_0208830 [Cutaneotrichosporon cavernicola]BEJ05068.1 hypothetical protein CcaverHIS641_0208850 [Cutaneotrichosporon cavernicola]
MERILQNPEELVRLANIAVGGLMIAGAVGCFINLSFSSIIIGIYEILAGVVVLGMEVRQPSEQGKALVSHYASFMHSFIGRGVFYILMGVLLLNHYTLLYVCGSIVAFVGLVFVALHFVPAIDTPSTMRAPDNDPEAQPVWQAPTE